MDAVGPLTERGACPTSLMPIRRCLTEIASDAKSRSRPRNRRPEAEGDPEILLGAAETLRTALALYLPPSQRSAVILKDVLGHSTEEIAELLGFSVAAVQGCLHRGRALKPEYERPSDPIRPSYFGMPSFSARLTGTGFGRFSPKR